MRGVVGRVLLEGAAGQADPQRRGRCVACRGSPAPAGRSASSSGKAATTRAGRRGRTWKNEPDWLKTAPTRGAACRPASSAVRPPRLAPSTATGAVDARSRCLSRARPAPICVRRYCGEPEYHALRCTGCEQRDAVRREPAGGDEGAAVAASATASTSYSGPSWTSSSGSGSRAARSPGRPDRHRQGVGGLAARPPGPRSRRPRRAPSATGLAA